MCVSFQHNHHLLLDMNALNQAIKHGVLNHIIPQDHVTKFINLFYIAENGYNVKYKFWKMCIAHYLHKNSWLLSLPPLQACAI
jgi:hypothetical protein